MNQSFCSAICWLRVTDYMRGWLRCTLGGPVSVKGEPVLSVRQLPGMKEVMMMETEDVLRCSKQPELAMSATWHNALEIGLEYDPGAISEMYGVTADILQRYVPIACPFNTVTKDGVIRPWTNDTCFSHQQATELLKILRREFWEAVAKFSVQYANEHQGLKYAQVEMIEAFCRETGTDDLYIEPIRREWQRRIKRKKG